MKIADLKLEIIRAVLKTDNIPVLTLLKKQIEHIEKGEKEIAIAIKPKTVKSPKTVKKAVTNKKE